MAALAVGLKDGADVALVTNGGCVGRDVLGFFGFVGASQERGREDCEEGSNDRRESSHFYSAKGCEDGKKSR